MRISAGAVTQAHEFCPVDSPRPLDIYCSPAYVQTISDKPVKENCSRILPSYLFCAQPTAFVVSQT